ncbi:hypothetical protein EDC18_10190 [Natranaerovirga pectinivora]|uniref:Uncharacterized protein n=1 Tax=Natranaerovirga pectinivora TaxID=682400 RepID=A0A4R3MPT6_9FIRM|nr:hypothetical protein [Natranaerovirga pectinivora]TCT16794.1 hypothetical protein EDC18_10190 [Natranaerovirga pectinivora]
MNKRTIFGSIVILVFFLLVIWYYLTQDKPMLIRSDTILNLKREMLALNRMEAKEMGILTKSTVEIQEININSTKITIQGEVKYSGKTDLFNLVGDLKKQDDHIVVGELKDEKNNFIVLYNSFVLGKLDELPVYDFEKKYNSNTNLMCLYLLKKDSNDLTIMEWYNHNVEIDFEQNYLPASQEDTQMMWMLKLPMDL